MSEISQTLPRNVTVHKMNIQKEQNQKNIMDLAYILNVVFAALCLNAKQTLLSY